MGIEHIPFVGRSVERVEDAGLLSGRGRYIDDLGTKPGTLHAAILRSPHAHADIVEIDAAAALALPGIAAVITGRDLLDITAGLVPAVRAAVDARAVAVDRVRYVGEPVAVVLGSDRYVAEDGCDLVEVAYRPRPAVVDPLAALAPDAPILHDGVGANQVSDRAFRYGDPEAAFGRAKHTLSVTVRYRATPAARWRPTGSSPSTTPPTTATTCSPTSRARSASTPCSPGAQGPGNRLRLRTPPDSGGSFGVKQGVAPYAVLIAAAARRVGRPVKWVEDRLEHLAASVSATNPRHHAHGRLRRRGPRRGPRLGPGRGLRGYLRAPEPATLYRMHGNMTGAYAIRNVRMRNRVVLTNKTPTGLVRGFGGPQVYYPLERLMQRIAVTLGLDPLEVIRRNLIPADAFRTARRPARSTIPATTSTPSTWPRATAGSPTSSAAAPRPAPRGASTGSATPRRSSPASRTWATSPPSSPAAERAKAGPKNGAQATATITLDPVGAVTVQVASVPQGQGTAPCWRRWWRTCSGSASTRSGSRPTSTPPRTRGRSPRATIRAASPPRWRRRAPGGRAAAQKTRGGGGGPAQPAGGRPRLRRRRVGSRTNPDASLPFARVAATAHWSPGLLPDMDGAPIRETAFWTPPQLTAPDEADAVNSSLCHGFIFDFCGVEVDPVTGKIAIDRYVTMHDCGRILHPGMVEGQVRGGFAQALGAAVYEELAYGADGAFLSGNARRLPPPDATEMPELTVLHVESPSPFTPLGAKGVGEGNCMSTPVCLANAVADALSLEAIDLPLTPAKLAALAAGRDEPAPPAGRAGQGAPSRGSKPGDRTMRGEGSARVAAPPEAVWAMLLDPEVLASVIPGAHGCASARTRISPPRSPSASGR